MERKRICCLRRIGEGSDSTAKYLVIPFEDVKEIVIGRAEGVDVCIPSDMISRRHAIFKKGTHGVWTVTDNKSLNGIFVNDKKIKSHETTPLKDQDIVQLGVARAKGLPPEFVWKYCTSLKVKVFPNKSKEVHISSQEQDQADTASPKKRKHLTDSPTTASCSSPPKKPALKRLCPQPKKNLESPPSQILEQKLQEQERLAQAEMEEAQKRLEKQMREEYEEQLKDKEDSLVAKLVEEQEKLKEERQALEERLQNKTESELAEKDQQALVELQREKEKLDKVIQQKELEQKLLESQLNDTKSENIKQKEDMLKIKEAILHNFADLMETELQCAICNELFVFATSLQCSHSYCELCIEQWMETKKICPVCRAPITSHIRSIALDSYIDKMVEHLSDEMKESRKELVAERKAESEKRKTEKAAKAAAAGTSGRGRRGRRGRGGRTGRTTATVTTTTYASTSGVATRASRATTAVTGNRSAIVIASESESEDDTDSFSTEDSSDDSDSSVEGHAYYGGYGRCFSCGRRGHWANGCPF